MNFKNKHSLKDRMSESKRITLKYPDRIPIICEKWSRESYLPDIDKNKYLVPKQLTIGEFMYIIRTRMKLDNNKALFLFVNNTIPTISSLVMEVYEHQKDVDGFLYIVYASENVFG